MKKNLSPKLRLVRPADALMPLGLLAACLFTNSLAVVTFMLYSYGLTLFSLATARGVRIAFAEEPSMRRACGTVKLALLIQLCAALMGAGVLKLVDSAFDIADLMLIGAGLLFNIEHTFYEYLYATGDGRSAAMSRIVSTTLVVAGVILCGTHYGDPVWLLAACAVAAGVSAVIGLLIGGPLRGKLNARALNAAPRALIQTFLYPVAAVALYRFGPFRASIAPLFAGLALYELLKTPFRRSAMESRSLVRALLAVVIAAAALVAAGRLPAIQRLFDDDVTLTGLALILASALSFAQFGNLKRSED